MDLPAALRYLDEHVNLEAVVADRHSHPTLERMQRLMHVLGDPQHAAPLLHITGTNGKGSTAQIATRLLEAHGLTVGTYTSPHLQKINERIAVNGEPIADDDLAEAIRASRMPRRSPVSSLPTSRSSPPPRTGGSRTSLSMSSSPRSVCSADGTPRTSPTVRSPSSRTSRSITPSTPGRRASTSRVRRPAS